MSIELYWRLPVDGDGRTARRADWHRGDHAPSQLTRHAFARTSARRDGYTYYDQLAQIARAAELTGFDGLLIPQSAAGEEPLVVAGSLAREVRRLTFLPSLAAPFLSAVYAAKIAVSFQRLTGGRLAWNLVTEEPGENPWHGRSWSVAEQIARTDEFLDVAKGFWNQKPFTYHGKYYEVENGGFSEALSGQNFPVVHLSGDTDEALALSAKHADVHLFPLLPLSLLRERIGRLDVLAAAHGRTLRYGLQAELVARDSEEAAGRALAELAGSAAPALAGDNLWSGFDRLRPGSPYVLVGSYDALADRLAAYHDAGVGTFVLSAHPHLEEAYRIGEQLAPLLRARTDAALLAAE